MFIDIVFDGPPSHNSGRFVEVENEKGASINAGEWIDRGDGLWALRIGISPSGWEPLSPDALRHSLRLAGWTDTQVDDLFRGAALPAPPEGRA